MANTALLNRDQTQAVLRVEVYDNNRFLVQSETCSETKYLVDLSAYQGRGSCECPDFFGRLANEMRDNSDRLLLCKHLDAVHHALIYATFRKAFANSEDKPETGG